MTSRTTMGVVLSELAEHDEPVTNDELRGRLGILSLATVQNALTRLHEEGLVEREPHLGTYAYTITDAGEAVLAEGDGDLR